MEAETASQHSIPDEYAVCAQNLVKQYGNGPKILQNFCMRLRTGTIYSLLGSSGCGKTTIVSCIVGLTQYDSGDLFVLGNKIRPLERNPSEKLIGYMPQELALYTELSTLDNIYYFGTLHGMSRPQIKESYDTIKNVLELQHDSERLWELSGGQKRCASLAVALLPNPHLIILDEPTVGLDPLLREKIQKYLHSIVNTRKCTILITTHYIEEARHSNTIGIMRTGRLIAEGSPNALLQLHNCELLDDVVVSLCRADESLESLERSANSRSILSDTLDTLDNKGSVHFYNRHKKYFMPFCGVNCLALAKKMTQTYITYPIFLALLLIFPTLQTGLSLWTLGAEIKHVRFGIVNKELSSWATDCFDNITVKHTCELSKFTCYLTHQLSANDTLKLVPYKSEFLALEQVQEGKIAGYLTIPSNFSRNLIKLAASQLLACNETLTGSRIKVRLDHSEQLTSKLMVKHLYETVLYFVEERSISCGSKYAQAKLPINFREPVYGDYTNNYGDFMLPGTLILSITSPISLLSGLFLVADLKQGTFSRARRAGLNILDIILSHTVVHLMLSLFQILVATELIYLIFGYTIGGSVVLYCAIITLCGVTATNLGLFLGFCCRDAVVVFFTGCFIYQFCMHLGGVFFPIESIIWYWRHAGNVLPYTHPTTALRSVMIRNSGLTHAMVWPAFVSFFAWPVGLIVIIMFLCSNVNMY